MAEIKSTLEIIMEKTKGLTMSDEEKKAFQKEEVEGMVRGLVQKLFDGLLPLEKIKKEIDSFDPARKPLVLKALKRECLDRMDPEIDNSPLFEILQKAAGVDPGGFLELQSAYRTRLRQEEGKRARSALEGLKKRGFSGSAVIPNLTADPDWRHLLEEMKRAFRDEADQLMN